MPLFSKNFITITAPTERAASRAPFDLGTARPADLYDAWLFAEADATLALAAWQSAPRGSKADAHAAYVAALDRETHAAAVLESRLRRGRRR